MSGTSRVRSALYATRVAVVLWFSGVRDALCVWRCIEFFVHDPRILRKTGECFGLNGLIFLGSILLWEYGLAPGMHLLLQAMGNTAGAEYILACLQAVYIVLWLLPVYCISFALSCVWYQELAELAMKWLQAHERPREQDPSMAKEAARGSPVMEQMAHEVYRVVLFGVFYLQVSLLGYVPYIGKPLYLVLVSWLYALYSFDYRWGLSRKHLQQRIAFFQQHWAFFLGFGCVCTVATCAWPFFKQAAIMNMMYPLFILVACKSDPLKAYKEVAQHEKVAGPLSSRQLPIFSAATWMTSLILQNFYGTLQVPGRLAQHKLKLVGAVGAALVCCAVYSFAGESQR
ncbi:g7054 [Coccomyxa viridis]|uniref:G7054 protein n=1 Tax=Coccomyxa viridis TaxID=1274662 RepID=A0ABP1FWW7_9CHLO